MTTQSDAPKMSRDWSGRALALISLVVALSSLGYNTWRNETTERHRNTRQAAFALLQETGALQQIVDNRFYGNDHSEMTRIAAWGKVGLIRDLGSLVSARTGTEAQRLFDTWSANAEDIDAGKAKAETAISNEIRRVRMQTLADLRALR